MKTIVNKQFNQALKNNNLGDIQLIKGRGYFWITSDNDYFYKAHNLGRARSIYVNSFNQMTIDEWVGEIKSIVDDCMNH